MSGWQDGDGFIRCDDGHWHWGTEGAAGLLAVWIDAEGTRRFALVRRANCHRAGTYSIPGGAVVPGETPVQAALREAYEEGMDLSHGRVSRVVTRGCRGWSYKTVVMVFDHPPFIPESGIEHDDVVWMTRSQAYRYLPLHPGIYLPYTTSAL